MKVLVLDLVLDHDEVLVLVLVLNILILIVYTAGELKLTCLCATRFCILTGYILIAIFALVY